MVVFIVTFLFMGKEKVSFSTKGFGYAFSLLRGYYIFLSIVLVLGIVNVILSNVVLKMGSSYQLIPFINISIVALFVGIVEEFIFRGLIKDITPGEQIPFDDDFLPRKVEFEKKTRNKKGE